MKNEDWVFKLERQIVNNLKDQITQLDVANILEYNRTGEIKEISYVPVISNSLIYLWNTVEDKVNNIFFSNAFDLAEFAESKNSKNNVSKELIKEIKNLEDNLKQIRKEKQEVENQLELETSDIKLERLDRKYDRLSIEEVKLEEKLNTLKLKNPEYKKEVTKKNKLEQERIKKEKEAERTKRKEDYSLDEKKAIEKIETLSQEEKKKAFVSKFSDSEFMKERINNLSKLTKNNLKDSDSEGRYKKILKLVNKEARENNYSLKEGIEKIVTTDEKKLDRKKRDIIWSLTGGLRQDSFTKQVTRLVENKSNFTIENLEKIYRNQLRNPDLNKRQKEKIESLIRDIVENKENANIYKLKVENLKTQQNKEKIVERLIVTEMTAAYNVATFLSSSADYFKWSIEPEHERRNAVCLVCYERANGGYLNKGVYPKTQIDTNPELIIPKHPYCLCRYIPITKDINPDLFFLLEKMTPEQKEGYEASMDNWVNLSNNWSKLGTLAKGAALTAVGVAALWFAAKRFKKVGETIEKATKGKIKLRQDVPMQERSEQKIVNQITQEGGVLPERPQYGLGEVDKINAENVGALILGTNEGRRLALEGANERIENRFEKILEDLTDEELELVEVEDIEANLKLETQQAIAPLDLTLEGNVQPEYQNYPLKELYDLEDIEDEITGKITETRLPYELPVLIDLADQVINQFRRKHNIEIESIQNFINFLEGVDLDSIQYLDEIDDVINQLIKTQKKIRNLLRDLPKEVLSSKNKNDKNRAMRFYLNNKDIGFPFKGQDREGKAIGFVQEILKGEDSQIVRDNILSFLNGYEKDLKKLVDAAQNRRLNIMANEGVYDLKGNKVFYDASTKRLVPELKNIIDDLEKEIFKNDVYNRFELITKKEELDTLKKWYEQDLKKILGKNKIEDLPEEIQIRLRKIEKQIKDKDDFFSSSYLLKPTDITFQEVMDIAIEKDSLNKIGHKLNSSEELIMLEFLDELNFTNNYIKIVEDLDLKGSSPEQIKEAIIKNFRSDVNIKTKFQFIEKNKDKVINYIDKERLEIQIKIKTLTDLQNSSQILLSDRGNITEANIRKEIAETLKRLKIRNAFLEEERKRIWDYVDLKRSLDNNPTSYMNTQRRLEKIPTINKNLEISNKKFRTTQEKINYLKKEMADLVIEQQNTKDKTLIKEIENKIERLTEEIRKVQIAEFRRYEIEKNNNYIQYLSVRDNVLFSRIFREKLK